MPGLPCVRTARPWAEMTSRRSGAAVRDIALGTADLHDADAMSRMSSCGGRPFRADAHDGHDHGDTVYAVATMNAPAELRSLYGPATTEPGEMRVLFAAPPAREPVNPPIVASIGPRAAVGDTAIPIPMTMIGSKFPVSDPPTPTVRMLPLMVADALRDPGDIAVDGVPTNHTVEPEPALSASATSNEPTAGGIPATPASLKDRSSVFPEEPPRWIAPTPVTVTLPNAAGTGVAFGAAVAVGRAVGRSVGGLVHATKTRAAARQSRFTAEVYAPRNRHVRPAVGPQQHGPAPGLRAGHLALASASW